MSLADPSQEIGNTRPNPTEMVDMSKNILEKMMRKRDAKKLEKS